MAEPSKKTAAPPSDDENTRYREIRAKAQEDSEVLSLQDKMDNANDDAAAKTTRDYYRALFEKMRKIDPALKERIDRTEAATLRRLVRPL